MTEHFNLSLVVWIMLLNTNCLFLTCLSSQLFIILHLFRIWKCIVFNFWFQADPLHLHWGLTPAPLPLPWFLVGLPLGNHFILHALCHHTASMLHLSRMVLQLGIWVCLVFFIIFSFVLGFFFASLFLFVFSCIIFFSSALLTSIFFWGSIVFI